MDGAAPWELCPDGVLQSLGMHRMGQRPRIPPSGERRRSFISLVLRLSVSNNISPKPLSSVCSPPVIVCHPSVKPQYTRTGSGEPKLPHRGPSPRCRSSFLLVWDCFWPNPPLHCQRGYRQHPLGSQRRRAICVSEHGVE